jgi:hypothetical protein
MLLALTLLAIAAACGPTANALPTALPGSEGSTEPGANASAGAGSPLPSGAIVDPAVAWPAYAACIRAHGVEIADPEVDQYGDPTWVTNGQDLKTMINGAILRDCGPIIAAITEGGTGNDRPRKSYSFDSLLAHVACLRQHGLTEYPDPNPNDLAAGMAPGFDKSDSHVLAALIACEDLLVETTASPSPAL